MAAQLERMEETAGSSSSSQVVAEEEDGGGGPMLIARLEVYNTSNRIIDKKTMYMTL